VSLSSERVNIFRSVMDRWHHPDKEVEGAREEEYFEVDEYSKFLRELGEHGVDDFLGFLEHTLCTYPAISTFLIKCLAKANHNEYSQHDGGFDT